MRRPGGLGVGAVAGSSMPASPAPAARSPLFQDANLLPVAGVIPFSATDWPGKLTATVFTQGCPLRCVYCHNAQLQEFPGCGASGGAHGGVGSEHVAGPRDRAGEHRSAGSREDEGQRIEPGTGAATNWAAEAPTGQTFADVMALLEQRRGLLDGLVISGGEPLAAPQLPAAIAAAKAAGFPVGLHTSGYAPARLRALLAEEATRPDWIGLDVKALPRHIAEVTGLSPRAAERMWESLALVAAAAEEHGVDVQMRTTLWPGSVIEEHLEELESAVRELGHELHLQWARGVDATGTYVP